MSDGRRNQFNKKLIKISSVIAGLYAVMRWVAQRDKETAEIDSGNVYLRIG